MVLASLLSSIKYYIMFMPPNNFSLRSLVLHFRWCRIFCFSFSFSVFAVAYPPVWYGSATPCISLLIFQKRASARQPNHIDKHELCMPSIDNFCLQNHNKIKEHRSGRHNNVDRGEVKEKIGTCKWRRGDRWLFSQFKMGERVAAARKFIHEFCLHFQLRN